MLKELTVKEALRLLADKYPEPVKGQYLHRTDDNYEGSLRPGTLIGVEERCFTVKSEFNNVIFCEYFAIEVPDKYRHMTQQECIDWVCLHGHEGYQVKDITNNNKIWYPPSLPCFIKPEDMRYRTIREIDGKIVYGEPQEFKVKVESK